MTRIAALFPALLAMSSIPALAQAQDASLPPPGPDWDMIRFEVQSWGAPVRWWQFSPQFGGVWVENVSDPGTYNASYTLAFHTLEEDLDGYIALERMFRRLPETAPNSENCDNFMTDQAYGVLRLTRGATTTEIAWNSGCMDEDYAAFMAILREVDELVTGWGMAARVNRTEDHAR